MLTDVFQIDLKSPADSRLHVRLAPMNTLLRSWARNVDGVSLRFKEIEVSGENVDVFIVGERQDMAMLVLATGAGDSYDLTGDNIDRKMRTRLLIENYAEAMSSELANENFITFFKNSTIIVVVNIVGHLISCTIVAYGFARLRAPGRNFLFGFVLATMMLP